MKRSGHPYHCGDEQRLPHLPRPEAAHGVDDLLLHVHARLAPGEPGAVVVVLILEGVHLRGVRVPGKNGGNCAQSEGIMSCLAKEKSLKCEET